MVFATVEAEFPLPESRKFKRGFAIETDYFTINELYKVEEGAS